MTHSPRALIVAVIGAHALLAACPREAPVKRVVDAGPARVVDAGVVDAGVVVPKPAPVVTVDAGTPATAASVDDKGAAQKQITVKGPASIVWKVIGGNHQGPGTATVRTSAPSVIALDSKRGSTHNVPIIDGVADFRALPNGKLVVRASPDAQIFLGTDLVGSVPPTKTLTLPHGDYSVRLVSKAKVKTQRVRVADAPAEVRVRMDD